MPSGSFEMSPLLAELLSVLERPVLDDRGALSCSLKHQLQSGLLWLHRQGEPESTELAALLEQIFRRLVQDGISSRITLQKAQFELQLLRQSQASNDDGRVSGEAKAMGLLIARLLPGLSESMRGQVFSPADYKAQNPDVVEAGVDPLEHYISTGAAEGRAPLALTKLASRSCPNSAITSLADLTVYTGPPKLCREMQMGLRDEALMMLGQKRPDVSVILPTWNRAPTVLAAVSSALLQSFAPLEVIVVDDGSTDATVALLKSRFREPIEDGRLVVVANEKAGVSAARNAGLDRAQGDVIAYLDSDNHWETDHLLFAVAGLLAVKDAKCAYTALCRHDLASGHSDILFRPYDADALAEENYIDLNSFVHHRALFERLGGFDTALTRLVDWDLVLRYTTNNAPVALPVITGHHVIDNAALENISTQENLEPNLARIRDKLQIRRRTV